MTTLIPNYSSWAREALKEETTRLKLGRAEKLKNATSFDDALRVKLVMYDAKYHAAYAALLGMTKPMDIDAFARSTLSIDWHRRMSEEFLAIALGTQNQQQVAVGEEVVAV